MNRDLYTSLLKWKSSPRRKPLILRGARQVGKTYLLKHFGKNEYEDLAYFNFEEDPNLKDFFSGRLNPAEILRNLRAYTSRPLLPEKTLMIFDEIQECETALNSLKYFSETASEYHVASAGSLLGIQLGNSRSFPVGKVNFLALHPLSFNEFLDASGESGLRKLIEETTVPKPFAEPFHRKLLDLLRVYYFVGGMPEAVAVHARNGDLTSVREVHREILNSYRLDFSKHAEPHEVLKISAIWESVPGQLARENKKFIFSAIRKSARGREYESALQWLVDAGLIHKCTHVSKPGVPLSGYGDSSIFKVYVLDVGLLGAMMGLTSTTFLLGNRLFQEFHGAFVENFAAQELIAHLGPPLYYWSSSGIAEVDFVTQYNEEIFPLEVKAGHSRRKKSLIEFGKKYQPKVLSRASLMNLRKDADFCNFPLYAVSLFPKRVA